MSESDQVAEETVEEQAPTPRRPPRPPSPR